MKLGARVRAMNKLLAISMAALSLLACSSDTSRRGEVGVYAPDGSAGAGGFDNPTAGGRGGSVDGRDNALTVEVQDGDGMTIEIVTLACAGDCADIAAVARGGRPPYTYAWEDGSRDPERRVCLDASSTLRVSATDTAIEAEELSYEAQTASTDVTATVLDCNDAGLSDGGIPVDGVYWAEWQEVTVGDPGSASAALRLPGGDIDVSYAGQVIEGSAPLGQPTISFPITVTFTPPSTFTSETIPNAPPETGMICINGSSQLTQTLTFSEPVRDPLIAVISMGSSTFGMTWDFGAPVVLRSSGPGVLPGTLEVSGTTLTGAEGNGVVELQGTFEQLSFTVPVPELSTWGMFTVGVRGRD